MPSMYRCIRLALDGDGAPGEVHAVPHQAEDFPLPHPGEQRHLVNILMAMPFDGVREKRELLLAQRLDFFLLDAGELTAVSGVGADTAGLDLVRSGVGSTGPHFSSSDVRCSWQALLDWQPTVSGRDG